MISVRLGFAPTRQTVVSIFFKPGNVLIIKWVILELIGKGAMGEICLARQLNLKRDAAISQSLIVNEMMRMISDVR